MCGLRLTEPDQERVDVRRYPFVSVVCGAQCRRCRSAERVQYAQRRRILLQQFFDYLDGVRRRQSQPTVPSRVGVELLRVVRSLSQTFSDDRAHVASGDKRAFSTASIEGVSLIQVPELLEGQSSSFRALTEFWLVERADSDRVQYDPQIFLIGGAHTGFFRGAQSAAAPPAAAMQFLRNIMARGRGISKTGGRRSSGGSVVTPRSRASWWARSSAPAVLSIRGSRLAGSGGVSAPGAYGSRRGSIFKRSYSGLSWIANFGGAARLGWAPGLARVVTRPGTGRPGAGRRRTGVR